jgi:plastocyanin
MSRGVRVLGIALVALLALFALGACGGGDKVGEAFKDFKGDKSGGRIGDVTDTPTPKPKGGTNPGPAAKTPAPAATDAPKPQGITVKITSAGFDPTTARVAQGSTVTVTNTDAAAHTYTSSDATYNTESLAPGQTKSFVASKTGTFQMEDRTRNWIIGSLEVVPR